MKLEFGRVRALGLALLTLAWLGAPLTESGLATNVPSQLAGIAIGTVRSGAALPVRSQRSRVLRGTRRVLVQIRVDRALREFVDVSSSGVTGPVPLVVVLHGRRQTPWRAERSQRWDVLAARQQAVVAYGTAFAGSWNAGSCCGPGASAGVDDVGYVLAVIRVEQHRHRVDPRRVYLVGFSNGGMLAYRFACARVDLRSAVAVVGGSLQTRGCRPSRPLDVVDVVGGRDRVVPYAGSRFSRVAGAPTTSIPASVKPWQRLAGRGTVVRLVRLPTLGHE